MASRPPSRPNIVVVCPECGHRQDEPRLVVSTICRRCRSHIEVRDGNVVGPLKPAQGPALGPPSDQRPPPEPRKPSFTPPPTLRVRAAGAPPEPQAPAPAPVSLPPTLRIRVPGQTPEPELFSHAPAPLPLPPTLRIRSATSNQEAEPPPPPATPAWPASLRIRTPGGEPEPEPPPLTPLPMPPGLRIRTSPLDDDPDAEPEPLENRKKKKVRTKIDPLGFLEKLLRPEPPKRDVLCVDCGRRFHSPAAAATTNCPTCGAYLNLRDFTIEQASTTRIQTRGNVTILRKASLSGQPVHCHHLTIHGSLETSATCSGDLVITSSGMFRGKLRCERLIIQKRARVEFIHPVETGEAIIDGQVTGSVRATRTVTLHKRSKLRGNITASQLILKSGASHTGLVRTLPPDTEQPTS